MPLYDVAISFAGEDRSVAELICRKLVTCGLNVFYDEYEQADLWGKDLYQHLTTVYRDDSKYCLMIISEHYIKKQWTTHERKAAQARAFRENREYILPLRLDDSVVDGLLETVGFIDYRTCNAQTVVEAVVKKVNHYNEEHGVTQKIVRAEDVLATIDTHGRAIRDSDLRTQCPSCQQEQTLGDATIKLVSPDTVYECCNGCQLLAVISRPGIVAWPGRGYRIGDFAIRNISDITIQLEHMGIPMLIPASKAALMKTSK